MAVCALSAFADSTASVPGIGEASVACAAPDGWAFALRAGEKEDGTAELRISLSTEDSVGTDPACDDENLQ